MLSFIISVVIIFYLIGIIGRFLLRYWIRRKMKQFEQAGGKNSGGTGPFFWTWSSGSQNRSSNASPKKEEGEITVTRLNTEKKISDGVGEYVDFEDVEELS